jgi:BarA-like signal transduction histidine kinase
VVAPINEEKKSFASSLPLHHHDDADVAGSHIHLSRRQALHHERSLRSVDGTAACIAGRPPANQLRAENSTPACILGSRIAHCLSHLVTHRAKLIGDVLAKFCARLRR